MTAPSSVPKSHVNIFTGTRHPGHAFGSVEGESILQPRYCSECLQGIQCKVYKFRSWNDVSTEISHRVGPSCSTLCDFARIKFGKLGNRKSSSIRGNMESTRNRAELTVTNSKESNVFLRIEHSPLHLLLSIHGEIKHWPFSSTCSSIPSHSCIPRRSETSKEFLMFKQVETRDMPVVNMASIVTRIVSKTALHRSSEMEKAAAMVPASSPGAEAKMAWKRGGPVELQNS